MNILTYNELKNKARREVNRLVKSQTDLDEQSSIDNALNAAFTIYHLIQWRQEEKNLPKIKVHDFMKDTKNNGLKVLHDIVTHQKHVIVTVKFYHGETNPHFKSDIRYMTTEEGNTMITEDGSSLITEESKIEVYFGEERAVDILQDAMNEFD